MSGLTSPQPSRRNSQTRSLNSQNNDPKIHSFASPCPIDEASDFYDSFSDLNLFLSKKIKKEIDQTGSPKKWSASIESRLLTAILPEFKKKFPKYRLGTYALKRVWEKVAYYYDKIYSKKGALRSDGQIDLAFMIRENLKSTPSLPPDLPPHTYAHQVAVKVYECLATLDGIRFPIDSLTKLIWSAQKQLLKNLASVQSKPPYNEEYDKLDKLIVKTMLEKIALHPLSTPKEIKEHLRTTMKCLGQVGALAQNNELTSTLSMLLATKFLSTAQSCLPPPIQLALQDFIDYHIFLSQTNRALSRKSQCVELVQRILSLYAIAIHLPRRLDPTTLKSAVRYVYTLVEDAPFSTSSGIESPLLVFIHAEMHLMSDNKRVKSLEELEDHIIKAYEKILALPPLASFHHEQIERLIWTTLAAKEHSLSHLSSTMRSFMEKELGNLLIDNPGQTFRHVISHALQFFKQMQTLFANQSSAAFFREKVEEKMEIWVLQNTMVSRSIHLDEKSPLFKHLFSQWKANLFELRGVSIEQTQKAVQTAFPLLQPFSAELKTRLWVITQYLWYTKLSSSSESPYDRFLKWHAALIKLKNPSYSKQEVERALEKLSEKLAPLIPFNPLRG